MAGKTKKGSFGAAASKMLGKPHDAPTSMSDFLSDDVQDDPGVDETIDYSPAQAGPPADAPPVNDSVVDDTQSSTQSPLTEITTINFSPAVMEKLDLAKVKLRHLAPPGQKKRISKSLIINVVLEMGLAQFESDPENSEIYRRLIEG